MKLLFIGHYKESGGWAEASLGLIKAIESAGIDVVTRNVQLTQNSIQREEISHLEQKDISNVDFCIQHILPHFMVSSQKFKKNIGYFVTETENTQHMSWNLKLKSMDEIWTPAEDCLNELKSCKVKAFKVPHAFDCSAYKPQEKRGSDKFRFYNISTISERKNIEELVKIYLSTFSSRDQVELTIKIGGSQGNEGHVKQILSKMIEEKKRKLRIYNDYSKYPQINLITDNISGEEMIELHKNSDCFVSTSHGEAWCIPAFEAMCWGNTPVCVSWGGPKEYIDNSNKDTGSLIDYTMSNCENEYSPFSFTNTGKEYWCNPDARKFAESMKYYYNNSRSLDRMAGLRSAERFSLKNVGMLIKERITNE